MMMGDGVHSARGTYIVACIHPGCRMMTARARR
eukprot:SAG31_NODE_12031_length_975_cov_1.547945_2_plen_32_part_01